MAIRIGPRDINIRNDNVFIGNATYESYDSIIERLRMTSIPDIKEDYQGIPEIPLHFLNLLRKLPVEERTCCICLEEINTDIVITQCYHLFHKKCLSLWTKNSCPSCRKFFKPPSQP